jgi:hypothetical protein
MAVRNVAVVVDRAFSDRLSELARLRHVWVVESPTNTAAIRDIWQGMSAESCPQSGVTSFEDDANQSAEELCADIVGVVDEHHGEFSSDPCRVDAGAPNRLRRNWFIRLRIDDRWVRLSSSD